MKTIMVGECAPDRVYSLTDPDAPYEPDLEAATIKILSCLYPRHWCIVFTGGFEHEGRVSRADLALVAKDFSHWFVIEVELVSHSLTNHVLPQVTAFRYGAPQPDCASIFERALSVTRGQAQTLALHVPRTVVVIANRRDPKWETSLGAHQVQFGVISTFKTATGIEAIEFDGALGAIEESLGFSAYSAIDRSFRLPAQVTLPNGEIQIADPKGTPGTWRVIRDARWAWVTKEHGVPAIPDGQSVQLRRMFDGSISMKVVSG